MELSSYASESAYNLALRGVAEGGTMDEVRGTLQRLYGRYINYRDIQEIMNDAHGDALASGVQREDIDPSWYGGRHG